MPNAPDIAADPAFTVTWLPAGERFEAGAGETLLKAALRAGVALRSSCRNGTCRACMCRLAGGRIAWEIDWPGLSAEEKREGFVLPCVARACSDLVLVDERG
ncbi:MAG TPA: 2Fe-2S iron-sulfur cluster-binding protein [Burkholderiaceae bacterium]